jgi:purine-nucleoside phosphorylase
LTKIFIYGKIKNEGVNKMLYEHILNGNRQFGTKPINICRSSFNCGPDAIQRDVIIAPAWKPELFNDFVDDISQITDGIFKLWNLTIKNKKVTYLLTGIGAPNVMEAVLALGCTSCKNIIFIGSVGGLDENLKIGEIIVPEYSICGDGACRYLTNKKVKENDCFGEKYYPNKELYNIIVNKTDEITKSNNVNWHVGKNFSIDTVIAQFVHIDEIIAMGCNCIEMETAVLFKSAQICNIKAGAIFSISDNTIIKKSLLSGRTNEEMEYRRYVRKDILTKIVLTCLE